MVKESFHSSSNPSPNHKSKTFDNLLLNSVPPLSCFPSLRTSMLGRHGWDMSSEKVSISMTLYWCSQKTLDAFVIMFQAIDTRFQGNTLIVHSHIEHKENIPCPITRKVLTIYASIIWHVHPRSLMSISTQVHRVKGQHTSLIFTRVYTAYPVNLHNQIEIKHKQYPKIP